MRIETQLNKRAAAISAVRQAWSSARIQGNTATDTHARILKETADILKGCPQAIRSYVDGYDVALKDAAYELHLVYGGFIGDTFYSTHRARPDNYETMGLTPSQFNTDVKRKGHYWDCGARGMRPYYAAAE